MKKKQLHKTAIILLAVSLCAGSSVLGISVAQAQAPAAAAVAPAAPQEQKQVLIEARIWEVSKRAQDQVSFDWTWLRVNREGLTADGVVLGGRVGFNPRPIVGVAPLDVEVLRSAYGRLRMQLRALEAVSEAQVLATPIIITQDGKLAEITTKDKVPVVLTSAGQLSVSTREAGVSLKVTPIIRADGLVEMTISANVSIIVRYVRQADPSRESRIYEQPVIAERQIDTKLVAVSGHTILLGGLTEEVEQEIVRGVPILSKFPWLPDKMRFIPLNTLWWVGKLFESTDKDVVRKELFIEITPKILEPGKPVAWPTGIRPEDRPRILDLYNLGLTEFLPQDDLIGPEKNGVPPAPKK